MRRLAWREIRALAGALLLAALLFTVWRFSDRAEAPRTGMHFALIVPEQGGQEWLRSTVEELEAAYNLRLEVESFPSAAEQKRFLRLLPETEVDGVLLWPISVNQDDYAGEMEALQEVGVPLVVVDRDVRETLRDSFIGSGYKSDLLVLSQSLRSLPGGESFIVGNRSGGNGGQVVELLFFRREDGEADFEAQDMKLRQLGENPPEGYRAAEYLRLEGTNALQLRQRLRELFSGDRAPDLFFSLDPTLSAAAVSAKRQLGADCGVRLLCYGDQSLSDVEEGLVDGLVTSLPEVSVTIGVRYLRDICRGFWVPGSMDSGITLLTTEELEKGFLLVSDHD